MLRKAGLVIVYIVAWGWTLLAGVGGLMLLIHEGPLPITNGWFAMFSGLALCPLTRWALRRYASIAISRNLQFEVALAIFIAGRAAVVFILHRPFLPV
jgi:hypothetical protein